MANIEVEIDVEIKAETDSFVITGEVFISGIITYAFLDSRSTHSHASLKLVRRLGHSTNQMSTPFGTHFLLERLCI